VNQYIKGVIIPTNGEGGPFNIRERIGHLLFHERKKRMGLGNHWTGHIVSGIWVLWYKDFLVWEALCFAQTSSKGGGGNLNRGNGLGKRDFLNCVERTLSWGIITAGTPVKIPIESLRNQS